MNRFETKHINDKCNKSFIASSIQSDKYTISSQVKTWSDKETTFSFFPVTVSSQATSRLSMLFESNPVTTRYCNQLHLITLAYSTSNTSTSTVVVSASGIYPKGALTVTFLNYPIVDDPRFDHHKCKNIV